MDGKHDAIFPGKDCPLGPGISSVSRKIPRVGIQDPEIEAVERASSKLAGPVHRNGNVTLAPEKQI